MTQFCETPEWLKDIQNRSWEPEILISGLIITSIFLMQKYVFNFHAAMIQDIGFNHLFVTFSHNLVAISLTALKLTIIIHLIMRGIWAGVIGLSYVFPEGVKLENLNKKQRELEYEKPIEMVIKLEKFCSLAFSMIFTIIHTLLTAAVMYIPFSIFFFLFDRFLDLNVVLNISLSILLFILAATILEKLDRKKGKKVFLMLNVFAVLKSNNLRIIPIGILLVIVSLIISARSITALDFNNSKEIPAFKSSLKYIDNNLYTSRRNNDLRIAKAVIDRFSVNDRMLNLFVSYYSEDNRLFRNRERFKEESGINKKALSLTDLLTVYIDGEKINDLEWVITEHVKTGQAGFEVSIPLDSPVDGFHTLRISKYIWEKGKGKYKLNKNWAAIFFRTLMD